MRHSAARGGRERSEVLKSLPDEVAAVMLSVSQRRRYSANEVLFHHEDLADCLHVIVRGHVMILVNTPLGQQLAFNILGEGESFGELSIFSGERTRSATARALDATETLVIRDVELERLRHQYPVVNDVLLRLTAQHVRRLSRLLQEQLYLPVEVRIRRRVLDLCRLYRDRNGATIIPLSQDELAAMAGAARATVNRVLREEEALGILAVERRRVAVLDQARLRRRASEATG